MICKNRKVKKPEYRLKKRNIFFILYYPLESNLKRLIAAV